MIHISIAKKKCNYNFKMTCLYSDTLLESSRPDMAEGPLKKPS